MKKTRIYYNEKSSDKLNDSLLGLLPLDQCEISLMNLSEINVFTDIEPNSILVSIHTSPLKFVSEMERRGLRYGIIAIGDEHLEDNLAYVNNSNCCFVASEYFNPEAFRLAQIADNCSKLLSIRVRCNNDFYRLASSQKKNEKRSITWFFAGDISASGCRGDVRVKAIKQFEKISGGEWIDTDQGFEIDADKKTALSTSEYFHRLNDSYFALCPCGWVNIDTYRFYEALDAGCIPVVLRSPSGPFYRAGLQSYWGQKFSLNDNSLPFVVAESWLDASSKVLKIIESGRLHEVQQNTWSFWFNLKSSWKNNLIERRNELSSSDTIYRSLSKSVAQSPL